MKLTDIQIYDLVACLKKGIKTSDWIISRKLDITIDDANTQVQSKIGMKAWVLLFVGKIDNILTYTNHNIEVGSNIIKQVISSPTKTPSMFVTDDIVVYRQSICESCEHYINGKCNLCGCTMKKKNRHIVGKCPDNPPRFK